MSALVTISNVWNSKGDKEYLGEALYCGFSICTGICDLDFMWGICEARVLYPKGEKPRQRIIVAAIGWTREPDHWQQSTSLKWCRWG